MDWKSQWTQFKLSRSPEWKVFVIGRSMRVDRKIVDVCAVSLEEISFFDLCIVTFFPFFCYITRVPDLTSPRPRFHVLDLTFASPISPPHASPISRPHAFPRPTSPNTRPRPHVPKHTSLSPRPQIPFSLLATAKGKHKRKNTMQTAEETVKSTFFPPKVGLQQDFDRQLFLQHSSET